jgi:acetyltransferase-like isoleucine patch superfamily enzyme
VPFSSLPAPRALTDLATRLKLLRCARVGTGTRVYGRVWIHGAGDVTLGARVVLDGRTVPIELHADLPGSRIIIGDDVVIEGGASLEAQESIVVGHRCHLGSFVKVMDNHFHPLRGNRHQRPQSTAVRIEDDVVVEARAILLPGAHLQRACRVCLGAVVSRRVPEGAIVAGVPASRRKEGSP